MTVYLGPTRQPPGKWKHAHMIADNVDELHALAKRLGVPRNCFFDGRCPYYEIAAMRCEQARVYGAKPVSRSEFHKLEAQIRALHKSVAESWSM